MSKYVLYNGSFRELSDDELMHWKYSKREKKNGKWVYYYDNDKLGIKNFIDTKITGKAYKQHAQEATEKKRNVDNELASTTQYRMNAEARSKGPSYLDGNVIGLKKKEADLYDKSNSLAVEAAVAKANYENKSLAGGVKNTVQSIKNVGENWLDKLGVDEREEYLDKKGVHERAESSRDRAAKYGGEDHSVYDYDQERMVTNTVDYWNERMRKTGSDYIKAQKEYMNTPLGKMAKVTTDVKNWFADMFSGNKTNKKRN